MAKEKNLVAYCDILGTHTQVTEGRFSPDIVSDFANPVGISAKDAPDMRFAVFSDCAVISAPITAARKFLSVMSYLCGEWISDGILVRGGIACGEIIWLDQSFDAHFRQLKNLSLSRVYGKALVQAYDTEKKSGSGAMMFIHQSARKSIVQAMPHVVISGTSSSILNWMDDNFRGWMSTFFMSALENTTSDERKKQALATLDYLSKVTRAGVDEHFRYEVVHKFRPS